MTKSFYISISLLFLLLMTFTFLAGINMFQCYGHEDHPACFSR